MGPECILYVSAVSGTLSLAVGGLKAAWQKFSLRVSNFSVFTYSIGHEKIKKIIAQKPSNLVI